MYGDQGGNERTGLPGNVYRDQFVLARQLLQSLDAERRQRAVLEDAPVQTSIELQGRHGVFPGVAVSDFERDQQASVRALVERILATYPPDDVAYARACLETNGGVEKLFLSFYQRGEDGPIPEGQVFRLEGPGAVLYFRGFPHVHAFVNIAMDGDAPLSSGELLSENPAWLDRGGVKRLFEAAMRAQTGAQLAYYPEESVAGRLRPGSIRSGDIYSLESWQDAVEVGELHGSILEGPAFAKMTSSGDPIDRTRIYTVATTNYGVGQLREDLGRVESPRARGLLRDAVAEYIRRRGFGPA